MLKYVVMLYAEAEKAIGYEFKDKTLLESALTHSSYAETAEKQCYHEK